MNAQSPWFAPLVTAGIALLGVIITVSIQSRNLTKQLRQATELSREQTRSQQDGALRRDLWQLRYETYRAALEFITRRYYSLEWSGSGAKHKFSGPVPDATEYGQLYSRLRLLTTSGQVVPAFLLCLGVEGMPDGSVTSRRMEPAQLDALIKVMREDLGAGADPTAAKDFALIDFAAVGTPSR